MLLVAAGALHNDIEGALGVPGSALFGVDFALHSDVLELPHRRFGVDHGALAEKAARPDREGLEEREGLGDVAHGL